MRSAHISGAQACGSPQQRELSTTKGFVKSRLFKYVAGSFVLLCGAAVPASASQAYGSINNFDCVNDTGKEAHGFEIELDYGHTTDITYTYDYNHYGVPKITEDDTDPAHPKVFVRYQSLKNPDGSWASYTAIPSGPISPTMGHQFTTPAVNFGGEHFGLGFNGNPAAVKYNWLIDNGSGTLVHGPSVYISTPTFSYSAAGNGAAANVVAQVVPPPPEVQPPLQFGVASWVKEIKTTTHNPNKVQLGQLVGDDPGKPQPWANGEPSEVEMEWKVLQTEFAKAAAGGGKNGNLAGAPEDLPGGNEVITRRYEFYKYVGPYDAETGEAMGDTVGTDGIHGVGTVTYADHFDNALGEWVTVTVDMSKVVVVGDYVGAQMAGFDVAPNLNMIDHVQDGDPNVAYPNRTVVIAGTSPFTSSITSGHLPPGLSYDTTTGILSGTPTAGGKYTFTIQATDLNNGNVSKSYTINISGVAPVNYTIATSASPSTAGATTGSGSFASGTSDTVVATAKASYGFVNWTEGGNVASINPSYTFSVTNNRTLVANFGKLFKISTAALPVAGGTTTGDGSYPAGTSQTVVATSSNGYMFDKWMDGATSASTSATYTFPITAARKLTAKFVKSYTLATKANPTAGGTTAGDGTYKTGTKVTASATANSGYLFDKWTAGTSSVSTASSYSFVITANRTLTANFVKAYAVSVSASSSTQGTVTGSGTFKAGTKDTVKATAKTGYKFVNWTENGTKVSSAPSYTFTVNAAHTLIANFAKK